MFKKILLPTDGSELSGKAIDGALEFAKALGASVVGVTVIEPYSYSNLSEYRPESLDDYDQRMLKIAAERLGRVADAAARAGQHRRVRQRLVSDHRRRAAISSTRNGGNPPLHVRTIADVWIPGCAGMTRHTTTCLASNSCGMPSARRTCQHCAGAYRLKFGK